jgi:3-phenylpropionate/trans-cinnamate dioxygenase ferredoxin subunit
MPLIRVCGQTDLAPGDSRKLAVDPPVALFRTERGWFAIDDLCTHGKASLSEGFLDGDIIECPLHMGQFSLESGQPLCPPLTKPVRTHKVVLADDAVFIDWAGP